jgi:hypothetical protein
MRRMSFEEFKCKYFSSEEGAEKLWLTFKRACDLNVERSDIIDKIDSEVINIIEQSNKTTKIVGTNNLPYNITLPKD